MDWQWMTRKPSIGKRRRTRNGRSTRANGRVADDTLTGALCLPGGVVVEVCSGGASTRCGPTGCYRRSGGPRHLTVSCGSCNRLLLSIAAEGCNNSQRDMDLSRYPRRLTKPSTAPSMPSTSPSMPSRAAILGAGSEAFQAHQNCRIHPPSRISNW